MTREARGEDTLRVSTILSRLSKKDPDAGGGMLRTALVSCQKGEGRYLKVKGFMACILKSMKVGRR
jgi:hypothetical protein